MVEEYIRRDYLAQDRTHLANERTLLSFWRTGLAFLIAGAVLIKFSPSVIYDILALNSILLGTFLFGYGVIRYKNYKEKINKR